MSSTEDADDPTGRIPGTMARLATEMVRLHKHYWGRGPESAKAYAMDDLVFVVMRGGVTVAERTMLDAGRQDSVRSTRQQFQNDKAERMCGMVEEVTGRRVLTYQSQILFDPDLVIEVFVLDARISGGPTVSRARRVASAPDADAPAG